MMTEGEERENEWGANVSGAAVLRRLIRFSSFIFRNAPPLEMNVLSGRLNEANLYAFSAWNEQQPI